MADPILSGVEICEGQVLPFIQAAKARGRPGWRQDCPPALHPGEDGRLFITPECTSFEEIEGQINSLQDELDELRDRARRAFQVA